MTMTMSIDHLFWHGSCREGRNPMSLGWKGGRRLECITLTPTRQGLIDRWLSGFVIYCRKVISFKNAVRRRVRNMVRFSDFIWRHLAYTVKRGLINVQGKAHAKPLCRYCLHLSPQVLLVVCPCSVSAKEARVGKV